MTDTSRADDTTDIVWNLAGSVSRRGVGAR